MSLSQQRLSWSKSKGGVRTRSQSKKKFIQSVGVQTEPVVLQLPERQLLEPPPIQTGELAGLPNPWSRQPRGGSKYSPGGFGSRNSTILRAAMPRYRVSGSRKRTRSVSRPRYPIPRHVGRGDYKSMWNSFKRGAGAVGRVIRRVTPDGTFARLGTAAGGAMGGGPGAVIGGAAGGLLSKLVGFGDYNVVANSLSATSEKLNMGLPVASFGNISNGTVVQHREYIKDVVGTGSVAFSVESFPINPGIPTTFPWLAAIAANYEQYEIRGMVFEYKSMSSDNTAAAASALGSIIMATDYDSVDIPFSSKSAMEQSQYCTSGKPSMDILHPIECAPNRTSIPINYIRTGAQPGGTDIRLYDLGRTQLALSGIPALTAPAGSLLGELWVTYEIVLYKPQVAPSFYGTDHLRIGSTFGGTFATCFGTTDAVAIAKTPQAGSSLGFTFISADSLLAPIGLSAGKYLLTVSWVGASTTLSNALTVSYTGGMASTNYFYGGTTSSVTVDAGAISSEQQGQFAFIVTAPISTTSVITFTAGTLPGTPTQGDVVIMRIGDTAFT